jgi:hypothetical protein
MPFILNEIATHVYEGDVIVTLHVIIDHMNAVKHLTHHSPVHLFHAYPLFIVGPVNLTPLKLYHICIPPPPPHLFVVPFEAVDRGFVMYGKSLYHCNSYT